MFSSKTSQIFNNCEQNCRIAKCSITCYRPQRSWAKVMFLQASVILLTGGWSASVHVGIPRPQEWRTPQNGDPPNNGEFPQKWRPPNNGELPQECVQSLVTGHNEVGPR